MSEEDGVTLLTFDLNRHNRKKVNRALVDACIKQAQLHLSEAIPADTSATSVHPRTFTAYQLDHIAHSLEQAKRLSLEVDLWRVRNDLTGLAHMILDSGYDGPLAKSLSQLARAYALWYENRPPVVISFQI